MLSTFSLLIGLSHFTCLLSQQVASPVVDLQGLGRVQGTSLVSRAGRTYFAFLGIRFGSIPLRFKASLPANRWDGILTANETVQPCCQYSRIAGSSRGVEDCLFLNVETPDVNGSLPVIVWIHGGGFQTGGVDFKDEAQFIIDEDVVFVFILYRLGAFGFLDSTDGTVAGNQGLKDQVLALKWVQQHIASFGGNPDMVTIAGVSAGAASVNYHLLSPMSQGLFHRGILVGGSSLNPWALQTQPKELFQQLLVLSNCTRNTTEESVQCLRDLSSEDLLMAQNSIAKYPIEFDLENMRSVPSIETSKVTKKERFIDADPLILMQEGKIANFVPVLTGTVNNEGLYFSALLRSKPESIDRLQKEWSQIAPNMLYLEQFADKTDELTQAIRQFYFDEKDISTNTFNNFSNILADRFISNGVADTAILLSSHMPVYAYLMNYTGDYSFVEIVFGFKGLGVSHADELLYFYPGTVFEGEDLDFSKQYVRFLASFAKHGKPTDAWGLDGQWDPVDTPSVQDECLFYELTFNETRTIPDPFHSRRLFWQNLLALR